MRVATFNLENLGSQSGDADEFRQRLDILHPQLERLAADIICLQEINAERAAPDRERQMASLDLLLEDTQYRDFHMVSTVHPATGHPADRHNLAILSRWPFESSEQFHHAFVHPPIHTYVTADPAGGGARALMWDRPFLHVRIRSPDETVLHVINLHLKAPLAAVIPGRKLGKFAWTSASAWAEGYYIAAQKRAGQALEVRILIDRLFDEDPDANILVAGDFNAEEREVPARIIAADLEDTANGHLASRVMVPLEHSLPESRRYTVVHHGRKIMLDHLFASRALLSTYRGIEIHNEALGDELVAYAAIDGSPESYHAPVVASFRNDP
ncbi:MAG TPA: endonuclease/exonuclease/phosphatase family protein [Afifellaceae bacterium]|nr:endonuclease/exonuclease/phosphatase family protein [Afifellaceae bacterium]